MLGTLECLSKYESKSLPEFIIFRFNDVIGLGQVDRLARPYADLGALEPSQKLVYDAVELTIRHEGDLQLSLPLRGSCADLLPSGVRHGQSIAEILGAFCVLGVIGQVSSHYVETHYDALVAVEVEQEFAVILNHVFQLLNVARWRVLLALSAFGELQPLVQTPEIIVQLGPIATGTQRTGQSAAIAAGFTIAIV